VADLFMWSHKNLLATSNNDWLYMFPQGLAEACCSVFLEGGSQKQLTQSLTGFESIVASIGTYKQRTKIFSQLIQ
jgi:hypothetical protein